MAEGVFEALPWQQEIESAVRASVGEMQREDDLEHMVMMSVLERREALVKESERRLEERSRELDRREALLVAREDREDRRARETLRVQETLHANLLEGPPGYRPATAPAASAPARKPADPPAVDPRRLEKLSKQMYKVEALVHEMAADSLAAASGDRPRRRRRVRERAPSPPPAGASFADRVRETAAADEARRYETKGWRRLNVEAHMKKPPAKRGLRAKPGALARPATAPGGRCSTEDPADAPVDSAMQAALARSLEVLGRETGTPMEVWRRRLGFVK